MNITIEGLSDEVLACYGEAARLRGIAPEELMRETLINNAPLDLSRRLNADEWEREMDEAFDSFAEGPRNSS